MRAFLAWCAGERAADLLCVLLILYAARVLHPELTPQNFVELDLTQQLASTSESNVVNQLFWLMASGLGMLAVMPVWRTRLSRLLMANWALPALAALTLLSATWALAPAISIRRSVQQTMVIFCVVAAVCGARSAPRCVMLLYLALGISMMVHLAAVALPSSFDWRGDFRGVYDDKNGLGGLAVFALLVGGAVRFDLKTRRQRMLNLGYLGGWLVIVLLTHSKTSLGLVLLVPLLYLSLDLIGRDSRLGIGTYFIILPAITTTLLMFVIWGMGIRASTLVGLVSPDVTFTGRTMIWSFVLEALNGHWLIGYGYQSFWNIGSASPNLKAELDFIHFLNQAHNGYLDLLLSVGVVGMGLMLFVLIQGFAAASRVRDDSPLVHRVCWLLMIFALLHNGTEASLLRGYTPPWMFLLFAVTLAGRAALDVHAPSLRQARWQTAANAALREQR